MQINEASKAIAIFKMRFHDLRDEKEMSQAAFAKFIGIARATVGFYENGERVPDILVLEKIAQKCNVTSDWLIGLSNSRKSENAYINYRTGLSDKAIRNLEGLHNRFEDILSIINLIIENEDEWLGPEASEGIEVIRELQMLIHFEESYPNDEYAIYSEGKSEKIKENGNLVFNIDKIGTGGNHAGKRVVDINISEVMRPIIQDKIIKALYKLKEEYENLDNKVESR